MIKNKFWLSYEYDNVIKKNVIVSFFYTPKEGVTKSKFLYFDENINFEKLKKYHKNMFSKHKVLVENSFLLEIQKLRIMGIL